MKVWLLLFFLSILISGILYSNQEVLIDFSRLNSDLNINGEKHNSRTIISGNSTRELPGTDNIDGEIASLSISHFLVCFLPSMQRVPGAVKEKQVDKPGLYMFNEYESDKLVVLEVTIDFSKAPGDTFAAALLPPFIIPAHMDRVEYTSHGPAVVEKHKGKGDMFHGNGVLPNTGVLKSVEVVAQSATGVREIGIILTDEDEQDTLYYMGGFPPDRWFLLNYNNPHYIREIRNFEFQQRPRDLKNIPYLRFSGIIIFKPEKEDDQNVILSLHSVSLTCDRAYLDEM